LPSEHHQKQPGPVKETARIKAALNIASKKSIHTAMHPGIHKGFRIALFTRELSMQETFEQFATLCVEEHPAALKILDLILKQKRERKMNALTNKYDQDLYSVIDFDNPFEEDK